MQYILRRIPQPATIREMNFLTIKWRFLKNLSLQSDWKISYRKNAQVKLPSTSLNTKTCLWVSQTGCWSDISLFLFDWAESHFQNISMDWPITLQMYSTSQWYFSPSWQSFQWGSHPPFFCTSVVVEIIAVFWLFLAVFTLYFATEKSSTFNGEQAKDFMAFGLKEKLNWPFNVGFPRGENDARTADSREPSDSSTNQQQG